MNQPNLHAPDWSQIPAPKDDGGTRHLKGMIIPSVSLKATDDTMVSGLAPGSCAVTWMVGKSTVGSADTGRSS